jgi:hypothetical protein
MIYYIYASTTPKHNLMSFFSRLSNGWNISLNSFKVLRENKQLIIFPLLSGISLLFTMGSFFTAALASAGWEIDAINKPDRITSYAIAFVYYLINYFIVVFFNTAFIHCTHLYFNGEQPTIQKGLAFSTSRLGAIFSWALFAATIGTILKAIQENVGWLGKIITGLVGIVWSVATFFVVPVIAFENAGPLTAVKRSAQLMKEKWGESLGAGFSFGIIQLLAIVLIAFPLFIVGFFIHPLVGIALGVMGASLIFAVMSAVQTIFMSAVYHNITGDPTQHFNQQLIDDLFVKK